MSVKLFHLDTENPAQVCTSNEVNEYLNASISSNTWKAYREDLKHFRAWGGTFPASPEQVALYLAHYATTLYHPLETDYATNLVILFCLQFLKECFLKIE